MKQLIKSFEAAEKFLEAQKNAQIQVLSNQIDASPNNYKTNF